MPFQPKRVFFERDALAYPLGKELYDHFLARGIEVKMATSHNRVTGIPGKTPAQAYAEAKRTLVVGVRRTLKFASCKPSAHYQLPLATSCTGKCEYCYLLTTLENKPYIRVYVNVDEILAQTAKYIKERVPEITIFEGAATSDPVPVESYTGALQKATAFFARQKYGRFRFVTKFTEVESLLGVEHQGHTTIRFSLNTDSIIRRYEHDTPRAKARLAAAGKVAAAGYPLGFLIAPIFIYDNWQKEYGELLASLKDTLPRRFSDGFSFELITHRFTTRAKKRIGEIFPGSGLPLDESERQFKYGQFGYGKYVYRQEELAEIKNFFHAQIGRLFPRSEIKYLV